MINLCDKNIVLFDGVCNLCTAGVQLIVRHDRRKLFWFASLQSNTGQEILRHFGMSSGVFNSFLLVEHGVVHSRSTAALRMAKYLGGGWKLLYVLTIIPPFIRDAVYDWIARKRYDWFGRKNECWLPTPEQGARFLD